MASIEVINWEKRLTMTKVEIIRFQLAIHCHIQKINISSADLDCLTTLKQKGTAELTSFCKVLTDMNIFKSSQSSRNAITRLEEKKLIVKDGQSKKRIYINPDIKIQGEGNILVDVKCFSPNKEIRHDTN